MEQTKKVDPSPPCWEDGGNWWLCQASRALYPTILIEWLEDSCLSSMRHPPTWSSGISSYSVHCWPKHWSNTRKHNMSVMGILQRVAVVQTSTVACHWWKWQPHWNLKGEIKHHKRNIEENWWGAQLWKKFLPEEDPWHDCHMPKMAFGIKLLLQEKAKANKIPYCVHWGQWWWQNYIILPLSYQPHGGGSNCKVIVVINVPEHITVKGGVLYSQ